MGAFYGGQSTPQNNNFKYDIKDFLTTLSLDL